MEVCYDVDVASFGLIRRSEPRYSSPAATSIRGTSRGTMAAPYVQLPYSLKRTGEYPLSDEHELIAEQVLGHPLPKKAEIHHVDNNGLNNEHSNLVICQDHAYHMLLHARTRIVKAGGNPNTDR